MSPIPYRSHTFDKNDLVALKNSILKKCMDLMMTLEPFKSQKNVPKKTFDEVVKTGSPLLGVSQDLTTALGTAHQQTPGGTGLNNTSF